MRDRYKQLAAAYLSAVAEKKKDGKPKSALVVSPTHAEADRITQAIRAGLKAQGKLGEERIVKAWIPTHLTDAQKADANRIRAGRPAPVPSECTGLHKRIAPDRGRGRSSRRPSLPSGSRRTGRRSSPWPWATAFASRPAARQRTASIASATARS